MMFNNFLLLFVFYTFSVSLFGQIDPLAGPTLRIKVLGTNLTEYSDTYSIETKLHLTITNKTNRKILLLDKYVWVWEKDIYRKGPDSKLTRVFSQGSGISYRQRAQDRKDLLDLALPSEKLRELDPGESFEFDESTFIQIDKAKSNMRGQQLLMEDLHGVSSVWLSLQYIYWDPNLDLDTKTRKELKFGEELQKKWSNYGLLWTQPIESEPIEIPLPKMLTKQPR